MKKIVWSILLLLSPWAMAETAEQQWPTQDGPVTVVWQNPDEFRDVEASSGIQERYENHVFATLGKQFQKRLSGLLKDGEQLTITVTDLDLAGDVRPSFGASASDIRIVKSVYPPMIEFQWALLDQNKQLLDSGEVKIKDLNFENASSSLRYQNDALHYELSMIERWSKRDLPDVLASRTE